MAHSHNEIIAATHFSIDATTRLITCTDEEKGKIVQYDHNSVVFNFEMPRYVAEHDMSLCDKIEIHFLNIANNTTNEGTATAQDITFDEDKVIFNWHIKRSATMLNGNLNFIVKFSCLTGTELEYEWNTEIYSGYIIEKGIHNTETVYEEYIDVLEEWKNEISKYVFFDWNVNDPNAAGHIRNRTHWVDDDGLVHKLDNKFLDLDWVPNNRKFVTAGEVIEQNGYYGHNANFYDTDKLSEYQYIFSNCLNNPFVLYINGTKYEIPAITYSLDGNYYMYDDGTVKFGVIFYSFGVSIFVYNSNLLGAKVELYMIEKNPLPPEFAPVPALYYMGADMTYLYKDSEYTEKVTKAEVMANMSFKVYFDMALTGAGDKKSHMFPATISESGDYAEVVVISYTDDGVAIPYPLYTAEYTGE